MKTNIDNLMDWYWDWVGDGWRVYLSVKCGECGTIYEKGADPRVDGGMKCGDCAYGHGGKGGYVSRELMEQREAWAEARMEDEELGAHVEAPEVKHIPY